MKTIKQLLIICIIAFTSACHNMYPVPDAAPEDDGGSYRSDGGVMGNGGNTTAGQITAGEWCDLDHWDYWGHLMQNQEYSPTNEYWGFYTNNRVAIKVYDNNNQPQAGVKVHLLDEDKTIIFSGVTDNHGEANLFASLYEYTTLADASTYKIQIGEDLYDANFTTWKDTTLVWNEIVYSAPEVSGADILFIVDATGSMDDELSFLKDDLLDILHKANVPNLRTGALFYRDEGDDYVTKPSQFSDNVSTTVSFIQDQTADGGGDTPEAVHTALESALQDFSWRENARTKLAFMLLDAPPHYEKQILSSVKKSITSFAKSGIQIIPIAASGVDKNTEFLLRYMAISTNGTYVFLTNDSGIGNEHIEATVGDYEVELLNALILRLITEYTE